MSIAAMRRETESQPENLSEIVYRLAENSIHPPTSRTIFTGSGDSWAAALLAKEVTHGKVTAEDPAELLAIPDLLKNKYIVLISASGKTRANLELARIANRKATKTIAVTSNEGSPLAKICKSSILLRYKSTGILTSGTISFTASLLACASLLELLPRSLRLQSHLLMAKKWADGIRLHSRGKLLFVGSGVDRAMAEYGAGKAQEVLGLTAFATYPEQVGHAVLFTLDAARDTVVCIDSVGSEKTRGLYDRLVQSGFRVLKIFTDEKDKLTNILSECLRLQYMVLLNAEREGQEECAFLRDKSLLELSNKLIY